MYAVSRCADPATRASNFLGLQRTGCSLTSDIVARVFSGIPQFPAFPNKVVLPVLINHIRQRAFWKRTMFGSASIIGETRTAVLATQPSRNAQRPCFSRTPQAPLGVGPVHQTRRHNLSSLRVCAGKVSDLSPQSYHQCASVNDSKQPFDETGSRTERECDSCSFRADRESGRRAAAAGDHGKDDAARH